MSSVLVVASPTWNPGFAVLPLGRVKVIVLPLFGVIVNLTIETVVAPVGRFTE